VTVDFNPVSTLFDEKRLKRLSGLTQIINVPTRHNAILDWCLTNAKKVVFDVSQLPPIGSSDHNAILIKPHKDRLENSCNKRLCKRDLKDSCQNILVRLLHLSIGRRYSKFLILT
jgi:fructose-1-phosphate kinase PfkB-like protein